jgi:iron(III) transport system permease protein
LLAFLAAVISTVIAFPIGQQLAQERSRLTRTLDVIFWLPIAIPGTIVGIGLIKIANLAPNLQRVDSVGVLLLCAYVGMFTAFSVRIFEAAHRRADPNVYEAAAIECRKWHQRLLHVDIRVHSRAIVASVIVVSVLTLGELNATVLLIPPGKETLGVSTDNLLHYGASATASALCLVEAALIILVFSLGLFVWSVSKKILG